MRHDTRYRSEIAALLEVVKRRNPLPTGTLVVGVGLMVAGLSAYGFISLSTRAVGEDNYGPLGALWSLVFLVGPGLFLPLEQEVSRALADRRSRGLGGLPVVIRAATLGVLLCLVVLALLILFSGWIIRDIFRDELALFIGLGLGLVGALCGHLARGCLSGTGRFLGYGVFLGAEGFIRFAGALLLSLLGVTGLGLYGLVVGVSPLLAVALALTVQRPQLDPGPETARGEVSHALGFLLMASLSAYTIMNVGPAIVQGMADSASQDTLAGLFVSGVIVARIPVFLFQAIQASLLPKLASLAGVGRFADFRVGLRRLLAVVACLAVLGALGGWALGPHVVQIMTDADTMLSHRTLGMLALGSGFFMMALAMAQAVIALGGHKDQALAWGTGLLMLPPVVWLSSSDFLLRVEIGLLTASFTACCTMGALLVRRVRTLGPDYVVDEGDVIEALHDVPLEA